MSSSLTRRRVLSRGGTLLSSVLAGCSTLPLFEEEPTRVRIEEITVLNLHDEPHLFDVVVRDARSDDVVFWKRYRAEAATPDPNGGPDETDGTVWKNPIEAPGEYVLYADAEREIPPNDSEWSSVNLTERGDCLGIDVKVEPEGYLSVAIRYLDSCR